MFPFLSLRLHLLTTVIPQGLYRATLRHPLTISPTQFVSFPFRMATPCYPSSSLNDSFRRSSRHIIHRLAYSHRRHLFPLSTTPVRDTPPFQRHCLSPCVSHIALCAEFPQRPAHLAEHSVSRGARDDATARVEHLPCTYDAHDCARYPRCRLPCISPRAGQVRDLWSLIRA